VGAVGLEWLEHALNSELKFEQDTFRELNRAILANLLWLHLLDSQDDGFAYGQIVRHEIAEGPTGNLILVFIGQTEHLSMEAPLGEWLQIIDVT
jgi:hypothetical protein